MLLHYFSLLLSPDMHFANIFGARLLDTRVLDFKNLIADFSAREWITDIIAV